MNKPISAFEQMNILSRGVQEFIDEKLLLLKLENSIKNKIPLRVKLGIDPTSSDIHLGFTVVMRKAKQFQDLGHQVVVVIGDYTAMVGDPSGKNKTRPRLSHEQVLANAETYKEQLFKILFKDKTEIVYNGDWFENTKFSQIAELTSCITVAQMLEREDFKNRYGTGSPISLHEFLYPLMQGLDSVMINSDVELGGTDQKFNILVGRELQRNKRLTEVFGMSTQEPQVGILMPILLGTCGKEKMSKSLGNCVGIMDSPQSMYHKIYSIKDSQVENWTTLLTELSLAEINLWKEKTVIKESEINLWKSWLAKDIVKQYYGDEKSLAAEILEISVHKGTKFPDNMVEIVRDKSWVNFIDVLVSIGISNSRNEAKKLIQNSGVTVDGASITISSLLPDNNFMLKIGKRKFFKIMDLENVRINGKDIL